MVKKHPYAPVHVDMAEHPKVAELSDRAFRAHVRGILYCNRLLTNGRVPSGVAAGYGRQAVGELVAKGAWSKNGVGYVIHDFEDWNPTKDEVEARKEAKAVAGRAGAEQMLSNRSSKREADAQADAQHVPKQSSSKRLATRAGGTSTSTSTPSKTISEELVALERDGVWQAMVDLWGQPPKNDRLRTSWGIAAKEIRAQGLNGDDVRRRYGNAGPDRPWAVATPMAFAKHMGVLERPAARQPKGAVERVLARAAEMEQR